MHIPDLRQQRRQLLILVSLCKDLLRVHGAEGVQVHQLHKHSWETELVLWPFDACIGEESLHVGLLQCLHMAGLFSRGAFKLFSDSGCDKQSSYEHG